MGGGEERCIQGIGEELEGNRPLGRIRRTWDDNIKIDLQEVGWAGGGGGGGGEDLVSFAPEKGGGGVFEKGG